MEEGTVIRGAGGGRVWAARCGRAAGFFDRLRGLLGRTGTGPGEALLIERCGAVHTIGMRFPLDLVFVDRAWRITRVVRNVRPGLPMVCGGWRAARVFESEAGRLDLGGLAPGGVLEWRPGPGAEPRFLSTNFHEWNTNFHELPNPGGIQSAD